MENKNLGFRKFRQLLLDGMRMEIAQLANEQREQKKTRKLANRPKEKSLQDIVDEINNRAYKIYLLLYYYRWIKHGLKYWVNRDVQSYKDYYIDDDPESWFVKNWDKLIEYGDNKGKTHGDVIIHNAMNYYKKKCQEYNIEYSDENLNYIMTNI